MKKISLFLISAVLFAVTGFAQLSGPKTIPGDYATIALAIADLNAVGVVAPGVTFTIASGYTETFASPTDGLITATGTNPNDPIIFQATTGGTRPIITAATGTSTTVDGIIVIRGGNYITFDGIDLQENVANVTATTQMEWGYALVKVDGTNGAQNNTIKNCTVTLNKTNANSAGIYSGNHTNLVTTALTVTTVAGANSNNKIYGNTISNAFTGIYVKGFTDVTPYTYYDQNNEIGVTAGNTISNYGGATTSYGVYLFNNNAAKISNNIISNIGTTFTLRGIYLAASTNASVDVLNNNISLNSSALTNQCSGIENAITGSTNTININNNQITGCVYATATTGTFQGILSGTGSAGTLNINNNTVSNNLLAGTGAMTLINGGSATSLTMNSNIVNNNTKTGASGIMYCTRASTGIVTYSLNQIHDNGFTANSGASASSLYGYYNLGSPTVENYINNTFYNLVINGSSTSTASIIYGMYSWTISTSNITATANAIYGLTYNNSSTGSATVQGIRFAIGNVNVFKNAVFANTANGAGSTNYGINVVGGALWNIYNNEVFDLKTPSANLDNAIAGINIAGGTNINVYYNSIYLNASSAGALFGTSGIYASITPTVDLRNNIVVNASSFVGATGYTVAYRRSSTTLTSYSANSNNNDFYAGTPGVNNLIYYDGTNSDQTMGAFQSRVTPRDAVSVSENPPFVNVTIPPYDLRLQTTIATMCESGGQKITTPAITDDIEGQVRWGEVGYAGTGTATDIGADEFNGIRPSCVYPNTLNASAVTTNSATIGWTAGGTELLWNIEWGTIGFVQGTGTSVAGLSANSYGLTGLSASTSYSFYVQADCGGSTSAWAGPFSFTTLCGNVNTFPYLESFDATTYAPICWSNVKTAGTGNPGIWDRQTAGTFPTCAPHSGAAMSRYNAYSLSAGTTGILVTPGIDFPTDLYEVRFWMYRDDGYPTNADLVNVYYNTSPNTTGATLLGTINRSNTLAPVETIANQWYEYHFNMPAGSTGTGRYVIFEAVSAFGNNIFVDDVQIQLQPTCVAPSLLTATSITTNSATLGWTAGGSEILWNIEMGLAGFTPTGVPTASGVTNPYSATSLISATSYDFYVQADCGGSTSAWAGPFNFTTLCNNVNVFPFIESFDATTYAPICWSNPSISIWDRQTAGTNPTCTPHSGAAMSRYDSYDYLTGTTGILVTPGLDLPTDLYEVRFWMFRDNGWATNADLVNVYYNTSPNTTGATLLGTINRSNTLAPIETIANQWYEYHFNMPVGSTGTGRYVIFEAVSAYGNNIFVDDVQIQLQPTCLAPTALTATSITTNSAILGWTGGTETAWDIQYGTSGFPLGTGTILNNISTNPYTLTGLIDATNYEFYVLSQCSPTDSSTWAGPFSFTTLCNNVNVFPFIESFDATTYAPICWSNPSTNKWDRQTAGTFPTCTPHSGAAMSRYNSYNFSTGITGILVTPGLDLPSDLYEVRFWMYRDNGYPTTADLVNVYYNTSPNTTGATLLGTINRSNTLAPIETTANQWYEYKFNMPVGSTGTGRYVIFEAVSAFGNNIFVDDVQIQLQPTCLAPTALTATGITTNSAILGWTGGTETAWDIQYGTFGFPLGTGTILNNVSTNPYTLTGLIDATNYEFYVLSQCSPTDSSTWAGPFNFTTTCNLVSIPYTESFNGATIPLCWSQSFDGTLTSNLWALGTTNTAGGTANEMVSFWQNGIGVSRLIAPAFNTTGLSTLMLSYITYFDDFGAGATIKIQSSSDGITWVDESTPYASGSGDIPTGTVLNVPINNNLGGTTYIAWVIDGDHYQYDGWAIDNINLKVPSIDADITAFTFAEQTGPAIINTTTATVDIEVVSGTNVTALVPTITVSPFATINPLSGVAQDYSAPFTYVVTAEDMTTTKNWTVNVTVAPYSLVMWNFPNPTDDAIADGGIAANLAKTIATVGANAATFAAAGVTTSAATATGWNAGMDTKNWEVEFVTTGYQDIKVNSRQKSSNTGPKDFKLQYKISASGTWTDVSGASITTANDAFVSGTLSNATLPADANNEASVFVRWIMTSDIAVNLAPVGAAGTSRMDDVLITGNLFIPSTENSVLTFDVPTQTSSTVGAGTVNIVNCGTDVTALVPTITVSAGATILPASGVAQDFTNPVTYTVTAEDGITISTWVVTVVPNALPTIALTSPSAVTICQGDTTNIDLAFTGTAPWSWVGDDGTGPVTFIANTSPQTSPVAPFTTTTYQVISVTDAIGCTNTSTDAVVVTVNASPIVNLGIDLNLCDGSSAILDAGNVGSTYLWSDSSTNQTLNVTLTNSYSVTVTNTNSCSALDTIVVTFNTPAAVNITENTGVLTSDATNGNQWYDGNGPIAGEVNQTYTPTVDGNYYVIVTDINGCTSMSNVLSFLISVNSNASNSSIIVYPNPANDKVWIDVVNKNASQTKIEIRTLDGRLLFENESNSKGNTRISVNLKEFASGIYIVKAISGENTSIQKLIVK